MRGLFSGDSAIGKALTKIGELVILSILWFFTSLPVITIGASTTALYYATAKSLRMDRGYFFKEYFKAWKDNFLKATFLELFFVVCLLGLWTVLQMMGIQLNDISVEAGNVFCISRIYYPSGRAVLLCISVVVTF